MLHRAPERLLDQCGLHWLPQVVERAQLHGFHAGVVVRLPGAHHHLAGKACLAQAPECPQTADARHPEIQEHHVEGLLADALQRDLTARSALHVVPGRLETVLHHEAERLLVVHDEDPHSAVHRVTRSRAHGSRGSSNSTVVPLPTPALSARIVPPCCSTKDWQMARPSPTPCPISLVVKKGSKMCGKCSGCTPRPASDTLTTARAGPIPFRSVLVRTATLPGPSRASIALFTRLSTTWRSMMASARTATGVSSAVAVISAPPALAAVLTMAIASATTLRMSTVSRVGVRSRM